MSQEVAQLAGTTSNEAEVTRWSLPPPSCADMQKKKKIKKKKKKNLNGKEEKKFRSELV
jgi:hypothetical protein